MKTLDGEVQVDSKGCYQSSYSSGKLELYSPGETLGIQISYPGGEEAVVFIQLLHIIG